MEEVKTEEAERDKVVFRQAVSTDMPFIYRSILMGTYHGNKYGKGGQTDPRAPVDFFSSISQDAFMSSYHGHLEVLFAKTGIRLIVACLESDPDVILGFSVSEGPTLHFVFVKPHWRKIGIASSLVPKETSIVTGFTRVGDIIRRKKGWEFNPFK